MAQNNGRLPAYQPIDETGAIIGGSFTPAGYRQVTATSSVFTLPSPPAGVRRTVIQAEAQALRWRDDGNDPSATVGMLIPSGGELRYDGASPAALKLIAAAAGAIANVSYYA
ncbi:hypothetical protein [Sphingomonas sp.]|uniref:hypothetical protein n=1 Tax=Sphingomonas sp. TaxID=28214 RepID=UPI0035C87757